MSTQQPDLSPGWYPDRITPGMDRWWDGTQWTSHTQPTSTGSAPTAATSASAAPAAVPVVPSVGQPVEAQQVERQLLVDPTAAPGYVRPTARNGIAWGSMVLGIVAVALAIYELTPASGTIFISTTGVFAIVLGSRALQRRRSGQVSVLVPEILGIVFGGVATVIFLFGFIANAAVGGFS